MFVVCVLAMHVYVRTSPRTRPVPPALSGLHGLRPVALPAAVLGLLQHHALPLLHAAGAARHAAGAPVAVRGPHAVHGGG